ncbi:hypothetical protein PHET_05731 [Paragonimus heterotremus]|uniref:Ig-like domain-containing protein n=1 Tax=Paragonimus heterotremus TaxID=100268 RepID=A0A8J4SZS5_9TREM|nr:hypothetical protein PHET_05731 [Paragonimus heterotremus]
MSDPEASSESSDFSDGYPTTTTISTVAVQAGNARIVLAVLRCGNWIRVRIQRMEPDLYDIGMNAEEARALLEVHNHLGEKLSDKQEQISQLLSRADDLVTQQTSESQTQVYAAMAESLNRAWRDLLGVLKQRGHLLELAVECFAAAEDVVNQAEKVEHLCQKGGWGHDVESVKRLIEEHETLRRTALLEPTHRMLNAANSLLDLLGNLSNQTGPSASYSASSGANQASVEARERVAAMTAKGGAARRHAEVAWNRRDRLLQLRLAIVSMETELERIVDWFLKVGEPRLFDAQIGTSLSECQSQLDRLMALGDEVREIQSQHTRLMRHLQQASSSEKWRGSQSRTVFETLETSQQELERELQRSFGQYGPMELDTGEEDMRTSSEETWRETHGAYSQLADRMRTTEAYIWEFLDRLENKRRQLHTGVVYYSECNVLLTQIYQLEADMKQRYEHPAEGLEDSFFERLNNLELRLPGLRQTLSDLRSSQEDIVVQSTLRSQLGLVTPIPRPDFTQSSISINVAVAKRKEIEDGIARCRSLFSTYQERSIKAQKRQQVQTRIEMLFEWLHERIERALVEHASMGTTAEQVADFEDFHRRLEHELGSRESELDDIRAGIGRMSPSAEKASLELLVSDLISQWNQCHQTIRQRLGLSDKFLSLLRRVREDEYQQNLISERMHQLDGLESSLANGDLFAGSVGFEGPERLRSEVTMLISRLEDQQTLLRDYVDQVTRRADRDLNTAEPVRYCQLQIQLNSRRLEQLRESWIGCERFWEQWKMAREYWITFTNGANQLEELITTSLSRMSRAPLPTKLGECERFTREHQKDRDVIDQVSSTVRSHAQQLGSMVGARPDELSGGGRGWRLVEIPVGPDAGLPASALGRRVRSELAMQLAGLETRWAAWDRAWTTRKIELERRGLAVGRLATIEEVEGEVAAAENDLQNISKAIYLDFPVEQVERAERDLNQLEATIPVLRNRVRSTAPGLRLQLLQGEFDELGISGIPIEVVNKHQQLSTRFDKLADATTKCRSEINLTLRLLRAIAVADNALSQLTFGLQGTQRRVRELPRDDHERIQLLRSEAEEQLVRGQALVNMHVPTLEQLATQHPRAAEARQIIQPTVARFHSVVDELHRLTDEVRVRTEQSINLMRPVGVPIAADMVSSQLISPPVRPLPPTIVKPLRNVFTDEGQTVILTTEFHSGLPPDANPYDQSQLQALWFKDGQQIVTPDYEPHLSPTIAELKIAETLMEDTAHFTCRIITPYGQAETSCDLMVNETHSPVSFRPVVDESAIQPIKRPRAAGRPLAQQQQEPPKFIRDLQPQTVREPETIELQCQAIGFPVPQLRWFRNGEPIDTNPDFLISELAGSGCLRIRQSRMTQHEGTYMCRATNPAGEAVTSCHVTVQPGQPPIIVRPLRDVKLDEGDRSKLTVQFKSNLPVTVEWFHNGYPIHEEFGRRRITMEGTDLTNLNLPKITAEESGEYTCVVRNQIGEVSSSCIVHVRPPEVVKPESPIPLDELLDEYRSKPRERPTAPRRRLDLSAEFDEVFEPPKAPRLSEPLVAREDFVIPSAVRRDRTPILDDRSRPQDYRRATSVPIRDSPVPSSVPRRAAVSISRATVETGEAPVVVRPLHNAEVTEGHKIKLECTISGYPTPTVTWLKNGVPLARSNAYGTMQEGDRNRLVFYDIFLEDRGEYTCVAENPYGRVQTSCRMDVEPISSGEEQPVDHPPQLVRPLPSQLTLAEGNELRLECAFTGRPMPTVIWLKDGLPPPATVDFQTSQERGVARLYIPRVYKEKAGIYQAVASNPFGTCRSTVQLQIVPSLPSPMSSALLPPLTPIIVGSGPEFTRIFKDIYIDSQRLEEVVLECTVVGVPQPTVYWTHNGRLITDEDDRYVPVRGPGPDDHCLIIRQPDAWAAGRYQAIAENVHGRATCSAVVNPSAYSPSLSHRPPSLWSLNRITRTRQVCTREASMPVSPATTAPTVSPRTVATVQVPFTVPRLQRETSAPPAQYYLTSHKLQLTSRQASPPIQLTFSLPRKERSLSRNEITRTLERRVTERERLYSSSQYLSRMRITPQVTSTLTRRVSSQPRLEHGYSSEEEHEHPISVVPVVPHYKTRMERSLAARPRLRPGHRSELEHRQPISVTPMVPEYRTSMERQLASTPKLERAFVSEVERPVDMEVFPVVPEYKTQIATELPARPRVRPGYSSERRHVRSMDVTPMIPEYLTQVKHRIAEHPTLEAGYSSEEEHEHQMNVVPLVPHTEFKTQLETDVPAVPEMRPGFASETSIQRHIEVVPMTTEYKTQLDRQVTSQPMLEAGYSSEKEKLTQMDVIPMVPQTAYRTELSTDVSVRPHLEAGYVSEGEHQLTMDVCPVVPEFKTQLSTQILARPELSFGHESRLSYERQLQWETELKQYQSAMSTRLPSRPSLTSIYSSTLERETSMNVVPVVPHDEHYTSLYTQQFAIEYRPVDVIIEVPIPPQFVKPLNSVLAAEGTRVVLDGVVCGNPQPNISWFKAGRLLSDGPDVRLEYVDGQVRLTLPEAFPEDAGEYICEAENVAGHAQSSATIVVQARLMAPYFVKGLESQVINQGQSVRMVIKVDGHPPPTVTWSCNGREITSSPHYKLEIVGDGTHILDIPEAYFEDTGRYTVIAKNPAGESVSSGLLTMQEPEHRQPTPLKDIHHRELTLQMEGLPQIPLPSPPPAPKPEKPTFTQTFVPEMELSEGERLVLDVEVWGNPLPFLHWFHNGQPLSSTPDRQITQAGPPLANPSEVQLQPVRMIGQLIINEVFADDTGLYTCVAVNSVGQAEVLGNITVMPKATPPEARQPPVPLPSPQPPEFIYSPPFHVDMEPTQPLVLEAEARGYPLPDMRLYHNGILVESDQYRVVESIPGSGRIRLQINQPQLDDQGDWTIVASNKVGTTSKTVSVAPKVAP